MVPIFASEGVMPEQKLESSTLLIESSGQPAQTRIAAFNRRGNVHLSHRNSDRAIDGYNGAIRLDPKVTASFVGRGYALRPGHCGLPQGPHTAA
jgi:hypothetical protein